jgi:hypothetical protein
MPPMSLIIHGLPGIFQVNRDDQSTPLHMYHFQLIMSLSLSLCSRGIIQFDTPLLLSVRPAGSVARCNDLNLTLIECVQIMECGKV